MKKKKLKTRHLIICLPIGILAFIFMSNIGSSKAAYSDNIIVDKKQDEDYSFLIETGNYSLYYANNENYHFIFVNFSNIDLTGKTIKLLSKDYEQDISSPIEEIPDTLYSQHNATILEFTIRRSVVGSEIGIIIEEDNLHIVIIPQPAAAPSPPPPPTEEEEEEEKSNQVGVGPFVDAIIKSLKPIHYFLLGMAVICIFASPFIAAWRYNETPIMKFIDAKTGKFKSYGRLTGESDSNNLADYKIIHLKKGDLYSRHTLSDIKPKEGDCYYFIEKLYPFFIVSTTELKKDQYFRKKVIQKTKLYYFLHFLCTLTFNNRKLIEKVNTYLRERSEPIEVREIPEITHIIMMDRTEVRVDIGYKEKIQTKEGEKIVLQHLRDVPIYEKYKLEQKSSIVQIVGVYNTHYHVKSYSDYAEALRDMKTTNEVRNIYEFKIRELHKENMSLQKDVNEKNEIIRKNELVHLREKQDAKIQSNRELKSLAGIDLYTELLIGNISKGMDKAEAVNKATQKYYESTDERLKEKETEIQAIKTENLSLKSDIKRLQAYLDSNGNKDKFRYLRDQVREQVDQD